MVRPKSIILFEWLYLASLLLGVAATAMTWSDNMDSMQAVQVERMFGPLLVPLSVVFIYSLWVMLWYGVARARSTIARWGVVLFTALSVLSYAARLIDGSAFDSMSAVVVLFSMLFGVAAAVMLFRPDASAWFRQPI